MILMIKQESKRKCVKVQDDGKWMINLRFRTFKVLWLHTNVGLTSDGKKSFMPSRKISQIYSNYISL